MINLISGFVLSLLQHWAFSAICVLIVFSLAVDGPVFLQHITVVNLQACCVCVQGLLPFRMKGYHHVHCPGWDYFCHFPGPLRSRTVRPSQLPAVKIPLCAFTFWLGILISTDSLLTMVKITIGIAIRGLVLALILTFFFSCQLYECQEEVFRRSDRKGHSDLVMTQL